MFLKKRTQEITYHDRDKETVTYTRNTVWLCFHMVKLLEI